MYATAAACRLAYHVAHDAPMPQDMAYATAGNKVLELYGEAKGAKLLRRAQAALNANPDAKVDDLVDTVRGMGTISKL